MECQGYRTNELVYKVGNDRNSLIFIVVVSLLCPPSMQQLFGTNVDLGQIDIEASWFTMYRLIELSARYNPTVYVTWCAGFYIRNSDSHRAWCVTTCIYVGELTKEVCKLVGTRFKDHRNEHTTREKAWFDDRSARMDSLVFHTHYTRLPIIFDC
jgi:hypothetical protein